MQGGGQADPLSIVAHAEQTNMLTVLDEQEQSRSLQDVGTLPFTEFSSFYAVSVTCSIMTRMLCK